MDYSTKNSSNYKFNAQLNEAKNHLEKVSEIAKKLGVYSVDIDRIKNQSLVEVEKILSIRL